MRRSYACLVCFVIGATSEAKLLREPKTLASEKRPWVQCELTAGPINIEVHPEWAPIGAKRFLDLVNVQFFDGQALFRALPDFIVQFGISGNSMVRQEWNRKPSMMDDPLRPDVPIKLGTLAYAGSGKNSRSTQMWISFSDDSPGLGKQPWETPFAQVVGTKGLDAVRHINTQYEDQPDQRRIEFQGYSYLRDNFPNLDYIKSCRVLSSSEQAKAQKENEVFDSQVKLHQASTVKAEAQEGEVEDTSSAASDGEAQELDAEAEQSESSDEASSVDEGESAAISDDNDEGESAASSDDNDVSSSDDQASEEESENSDDSSPDSGDGSLQAL